MATNGSKTAVKQRRKPPKGVPFKPNNPETGEKDDRINRNGRPPANSAELNALIDEIFAEEITDGRNSMSKVRVALNRLLLHKTPAGPIHVFDRRFGKVSDRLDISNSDGSLGANEETVYNRVMARISGRLAVSKSAGAKGHPEGNEPG